MDKATRNSGNRIRAIDLFCGAGGSSYGARLAGVELVAAFDIWQPAVDTYNATLARVKRGVRLFTSEL